MSRIIPVVMPKFGLAMTEGKVVSWTKPEGSVLAAGDELAEIETTKITNVYESPAAGILRRHVAAEQQEFPVGALIAVIADTSVSDGEIDAFIKDYKEPPPDAADRGETGADAAPASIDADGRTIRFLDMGVAHPGLPILLIHGFGGDLNSWMFLQPLLARTHRVIAYDLPGHGASSKSVSAGDLGMFRETQNALLLALDLSRVHLVGHSLGGAIALSAALHIPEHVASLTLIAPVGLGDDINRQFVDGFVAAERRKQIEPVLDLLFSNKNLISRDVADNLMKYKRLDGVQAALAAIVASNFPGGHQASQLRARLSEPRPYPAQIIWGASDAILSARQIEGLPDDIGKHVLPDAGHMPHMERPAEIAKLIESLIASRTH